jgi:hypothetical protein
LAAVGTNIPIIRKKKQFIPDNHNSCYSALYLFHQPESAAMAKAAANKSLVEKQQSRPEQTRRAVEREAAAARKLKIFEQLKKGYSVARIAFTEECTPRRIRQIVAEMLEKREIDPPAGFAQLQIARLNDAMRIAHGRMLATSDLQALDRFVKVVRELDRYHGFGRAAAAPPLEAPAPARIAPPPRALRAPEPAPEEAKAEIFRAASD